MSRIIREAGIDTSDNRPHERKIEVSSWPAGENHMIVRGRLTDERFGCYYKFTGECVDAGILHDMTIVLLISTTNMVIDDIEVIMDRFPRLECGEMAESLDSVKGLRIVGGFSSKVRELAGGNKGCTHMVHLLTTMAPAVMQGYWAWKSGKPVIPGKLNVSRVSGMAETLKDTCYVWREDGEAYKKLIKLINKPL